MRYVMDARYAGPKPSGIGHYVRAIGKRLAHLGQERAFTYWVRPGTAPLVALPNVEHECVRAAPTGLRSLLSPSSLGRLERDDVFHAPANILGFNLPCPAIATVHDVMWLDHLAWCQPRPWLRPVSRAYYFTGIMRALRKAARILTVSQASADAIFRLVPEARARLVVTPNAYEPHFRPPDDVDEARARAARCLGFAAPYFLMVGQSQPSKGHDVAIRAFAASPPTSRRLVLVQRIEAGRGLHRLVRQLGLEGRVAFVPSLPERELLALLQAATALIQPSLAEGFGMPALEAIASGCPVIASDIPPLREVLGAAGTFVPPADVLALSRALTEAEREPSLLSELRARGLEQARRFSWDRSAELTWEVYRDVAARGH